MAVLLLAVTLVVVGRARWAAVAGAIATTVGVVGAVLLGLGVVVWMRLDRLRRRRADGRRALSQRADLADLVGLALTSGHNLTGALAAALPHVDDRLSAELAGVIRSARHRGVARALADAGGQGEDLYRTMSRSVSTGSSTLDVVSAFAAEQRSREHAAAVERARKLPVKLLFPLALLVLPGFTLVLLGPAVVGALDRLGL